VDISMYDKIAKENGIGIKKILFDKIYFKGIVGYNFLMLSKSFYQSFSQYNYILIHQLDCFVFEDKLDFWAQKKYDYIGSPWFAHYMDYAEDRPFWYNGNGGFSLRNTQAFLRVLNWKFPLRKMPQIKDDFKEMKMSKLRKNILYIFTWLGYHNTIGNFWKKMGYFPQEIETAFTDDKPRANEDVLWSNMFKYTRVQIKTPDFIGGLGFSFERSPDYLYKQNNNELPFGCHAWWKYDLSFWKPFIESYGYKLNSANQPIS
jgi:hypothetical protein